MKKNSVLAMACAMALASCGGGTTATNSNEMLTALLTAAAASGAATNTTPTQAATPAGQGLLGSLISGLLGNLTPVSAASVKGNWTYTSPECRFESENMLSQAGGAVVANKVEQELGTYMSKVGFTAGATTFTFDGTNKCTIATGNRVILNGTYTIDSSTRAINIKSTTGLISLSGTAYQSGNTLTLLFDSTKMLAFIKGASALLGGSTGTLGTLFNYSGMQLGMNLNKQ